MRANDGLSVQDRPLEGQRARVTCMGGKLVAAVLGTLQGMGRTGSCVPSTCIGKSECQHHKDAWTDQGGFEPPWADRKGAGRNEKGEPFIMRGRCR